MSQDDNNDLFPSGFRSQPFAAGDTDFGLPEFPESLWLSQMLLSRLDGSTGLAYRLVWGEAFDTGDPRIDGELWLTAHQARVLFDNYEQFRRLEPEEG